MHTDILFGLLKDMVRARKEMTDRVDGAPKCMIPGQTFHIDTNVEGRTTWRRCASRCCSST